MESRCSISNGRLKCLKLRWALATTLLSSVGHAAETTFLKPYNTEAATNGPMPAVEVIAKTRLPPGFRLSVFAAEPDVQQPIAMATDARGRLWVAENYTYSEAKVDVSQGICATASLSSRTPTTTAFRQAHGFGMARNG
jgi:hypothetical protein